MRIASRQLLDIATAEQSDADLLGRFVVHRDEAAFEELVRRHGPAVLRVCRRLVGQAGAEDAFQAVFLVLACRAKDVRKAASVGSWLIGVAGRVARQMLPDLGLDLLVPAAKPPRSGRLRRFRERDWRLRILRFGTLEARLRTEPPGPNMADSPWLALRQAQEAVTHHRPEEAHRLIEPLIAAGYRKAWKLARVVVREYAARAAKSIDQHQPDAAWRDLLAAESLNTGEIIVADLRQSLTKLGLAQVRTALASGRPSEAIHTIGKLNDRGVRHPDLTLLDEAAHEWIGISELADRGEFLRALEELDKVRFKLTGATEAVERFIGRVRDRHARFKEAVGQLYDAAEARRWRDAVAAADAVLAVAPEHREAKAIRGKAWLAAAPATADYLGTPDAEVEVVEDGAALASTGSGETGPSAAGTSVWESRSSAGSPSPVPKRFLLWVDGVGAYLVCLSNRVTFGQATGEGPVDVPLFADVSRLHAEISRDSEGYVIESGKSVLVNGKATTRTVLAPGDRITLGATCQFLFHKPVAISSTARLELTSGDRLPVAVDGVLLMGNEVMLGPGPDAHVINPHAVGTVLLYRSKDGLGVRVPGGTFRVDDRPVTDRAPLPLPAVVVGDTFSFAVEPVTARM